MPNIPQEMNSLNDQVIATDFLLASKEAIKNYACALAETVSPQVRDILHRQLDVAIANHDTITNYMVKKGYYQAYNPQEQVKMDVTTADSVMNLQVQS